MKKGLLIGIITILSGITMVAQVKQYVLLEHFTNTRCSICASRNPALQTLVNKYDKDVHHISFHPSDPYPNCELHLQNPTDNTARASVYGISGTPTVFMLGDRAGAGSTLVSESELQTAISGESQVQVRVSESRNGNAISVNVDAQSFADVPSGNYRLFVAAVEKELNLSTPNGEDVHHNVFRDFLTDVNGKSITFTQVGQTISETFSFNVASNWKADEIYVLAFIQNTDDNSILNSGSSLDVTTTSTNDLNPSIAFNAFPNPVSQTLFVQVEEQATAVIYNSIGRQVASQRLNGLSDTQRIDVSGLKNGLYILQLQTETGSVSRKLIIDN